jgi:hypothetical protein
MARIFLSPLIVDIRASQSDTVFSKWKGINYIRSRVIPANPKTALQDQVRDSLSQMVDAWQEAEGSMRLNNNFYASGKNYSGFNRFLSENLKANRDGTILNINMDNGYSLLTTWTPATGAGAGQITITFAPTPVPAGKKLLVAARKLHTSWFSAFGSYGAGVTSPQTLVGLTANTLFEMYGYLALAVPVNGGDVGDDSKGTATSGA